MIRVIAIFIKTLQIIVLNLKTIKYKTYMMIIIVIWKLMLFVWKV